MESITVAQIKNGSNLKRTKTKRKTLNRKYRKR